MDGDFARYDADGWPLCDFCSNRATSAEALLRTPSGNFPPVGRCDAHRRTDVAANYVTSAITAQMRRMPAGQPAPSRKPSTAVSARYTSDCPTCGARGADPDTRENGQPCRARSGRVTDTHRARIDAQ